MAGNDWRSVARCMAFGLLVAAAAGRAEAATAGRELSPAAQRLAEQLATGDSRGFESIVKGAYRQLELYTAAAGTPVTVKLGDFRTVYRPELDAVRYFDLVTAPGDYRLEVIKHNSLDRVGGRRTTRYQAAWASGEVSPDGDRFATATVAELGDVFVQEGIELGRLRAATSYRVILQLAGETRRYRAAILWSSDVRGREWRNHSFMFLDPIVSSLTSALTEVVPAGGEPLPSDGPGEGFTTAAYGSYACYTAQSTLSPPLQTIESSNRHNTGKHWGVLSAEFRCSCSSDCTSTCEVVRYPALGCTETGSTTQGYHVLNTSVTQESAIKADAIGAQGATCKAAFICGAKQCSFPGCAFNVSVSINGGAVSFSAPDAFWSAQMVATGECPGCNEVDDPNGNPPDVQDPWGSGGGGGTSGGFGPGSCFYSEVYYVNANGGWSLMGYKFVCY
jgi:hypothetical protein